MKIKKGDTVQVLTGKDRGLRGKVIVAYPEDRPRARRGCQPDQEAHQAAADSARGSQTGGIVVTEAPVHVSNVAYIHPKTGKPGRLGYRFDDDGNKVRVCRSGGDEVDV